jgi:hypothetical protein
MIAASRRADEFPRLARALGFHAGARSGASPESRPLTLHERAFIRR